MQMALLLYFKTICILIKSHTHFNSNNPSVCSNCSVVWLTLDSANHCLRFHTLGQWFGPAAPVVDGECVGACDRGERSQASGVTFTRAHRHHGGRVSRRCNRSDPRDRPRCIWYTDLRTHTPAEQPFQGIWVCVPMVCLFYTHTTSYLYFDSLSSFRAGFPNF